MSNPTGDESQPAQDDKREGELLSKIQANLEDLFSDSHLAEDGFLLKHVQKNKQGYVSLKLLTCLKKIKALTTNWYMTLAAAQHSDLLEVNDECTKVRRKEPLPRCLLCCPTTKLLLACNISEEQSGEDGAGQGLERLSLLEKISQKFSAHGCVLSVWILQPNKEIPKELQCYTKYHKVLGQHLSAVVRFDSLKAVCKAYNFLKAEEERSNGKGMRVVPLGCQAMHHISKEKSLEKKQEDQSEATPSQENPLQNSEDSLQEEPSSSSEVSDKTPETCEQQTSVQQTFEQIPTSCNSQFLRPRYGRTSWYSGDWDKKSSLNSWLLRHKSALRALNPKVPGHLNVQRVLRQPLGPNSNKGFCGRGKPLKHINERGDQAPVSTKSHLR